MENTKKCCLCGKEFIGYGNNPYPLVKEQGAKCCDECNELVIVERIRQITNKKDKKGENKDESITRK